MGRKPNQLVLEFFERGAKLEDSSNRYQHTCKSCGEKFPKGRIDSLVTHLLKKCPAISPHDRQRALHQLSETPNQHGSLNPIAVAMRQEQATVVNNELANQFTANYNMSALETLAEVSRLRLDANGEYVPTNVNPRKRKRNTIDTGPGQPENTDSIYILQEQPSMLSHDMVGDSNIFDAGSHQTIEAMAIAPADAPQNTDPAAALAVMTSTPAPAISLPAAGDIEVLTTSTDVPAIASPSHPAIDPRLHAQDQFDDQEAQPWYDPQISAPSAAPSSEPYANGLSFIQPGVKSKVRGRFTADRRKEVQAVRKQGACIRCRMLKKPCSGGTPCNTCANIESARLWKQPCIRTRVAEEFDLYAVGLNTILSFHELSTLRNQVDWSSDAHQIAATHFPTSTEIPAALFTSKKGQTATTGPIDPFLTDSSAMSIEMIDQDTDDISFRLQSYLKRTGRALFEHEQSSVMRPTLLLAAELASQKLDPLLGQALDLWIATHVLVDADALWTLTSVPPDEYDADAGQRTAVTVETDSVSYQLINVQLRAYVEKRASNLAKTLMNDLERRLLQRQQAASRHLETFITAIIFLNCAERMIWLFNTWVAPTLDEEGQEQRRQPQWPLEKPAEGYVAKGERVADVLSMLLRMRGVPPQTRIDHHGLVRAVTKEAGWGAPTPEQVLENAMAEATGAEGRDDSIAGARRAVQAARDEEMMANWLDGLGLREEDLKEAQRGTRWDSRDARCWELRLISRLFLQEEAMGAANVATMTATATN